MKIDVLDKGYVRLDDTWGNDLKVVNAARASFARRSNALNAKDESLINYLVKHRHDSVLRHCGMTFEVYAPLQTARQWWKSVVGSSHLDDQVGWNETCLPAWQEVWSYGPNRYTVQDILDGKQIPLRSVNKNGVIVPNRVKSIWESAKQEVFTITDEFGNRLSASLNHRILTPAGYRPISALQVGDEIGHNGIPPYANKDWLADMATRHTTVEIAEIAGVTTRTIHEYKKKFNIKTDANVMKPWTDYHWLKKHYVDQNMTLVETAALAGCSTHTIRKWAKMFDIQKDHVKVLNDWVEKNGTFIPTEEEAFKRSAKGRETIRRKYGKKREFAGDSATYRRIALQQQGWTKCFYCEKAIDEIHHKDGDRTNNKVENLVGLCADHHYLIHGKRSTAYGFSKIVSIESAGIWPTYDIEMELENNFVAGGVIVHNSRRYVVEAPEFYIPEVWRGAPENKKQGSSGLLDPVEAALASDLYEDFIEYSDNLYFRLMELGVAPEMARLVLPNALYVKWYWSASLNALLHFLDLRLGHGAQSEIKDYALAIESCVKEAFPVTAEAWNQRP